MVVLLEFVGLGNLGSALIWTFIAAALAILVGLILIVINLTKLVVGYLMGSYILNQFSPSLAENPLWPLLLGILLIVILISIPILGGFINLLIAVAGVGALLLLWRNTRPLSEKTAVF